MLTLGFSDQNFRLYSKDKVSKTVSGKSRLQGGICSLLRDGVRSLEEILCGRLRQEQALEMDEATAEQAARDSLAATNDSDEERGDVHGTEHEQVSFTGDGGEYEELDGDKNGTVDDAAVEAPKSLSKNAQKNLLKMQKFLERKLQRKASEKEKRHQQTAKKRDEWRAKQAALSEEDKEKALQERLASRAARRAEDNERKEKLRQAMQTGQNLVLDMEFCELMKPNEVTSLVQQVMYSYSANSRAGCPTRLSLTGCKGEIKTQLERVSGFNNWLLHKEERSFVEVFAERKADLIYLTADSDHVLDGLDESRIYVIGGLVDRNRWKGTTLEKAERQGIATAKLPIGEHLKMMSSQVLTVNQVVEIMLRYLELRDWREALLKVIPPRKRGLEDGGIGGGKAGRTNVVTAAAEGESTSEVIASPSAGALQSLQFE